MASIDPLSNLLTVLRNASRARLEKATVPDSRFSRLFLQVMHEEGFIRSFRSLNGKGAGKRIEVSMAYGPKRELLLNGARRVSRPGCRIYIPLSEIKPMLRHLEVPILSTSKGVMSGQKAVANSTGGELLCMVW